MSKKGSKKSTQTAASGGTGGSAGANDEKKKNVLERLMGDFERFHNSLTKAQVGFKVWATQETGDSSPRVGVLLRESLTLATEIDPRIGELKKNIAELTSLGFAPTSAPRGSKFAVGETVAVDSEWLPKYTKSGLYSAEELSALTVSAIGDKEILTKTKAGREVLIRSAAHLEPVATDGDATREV